MRIVASDHASNPPDVARTGELQTRPFILDNTPPTLSMRQESIDQGRIKIAIEASDATSTLSQSEISVDTGKWMPVFPDDGILDARTEAFTFVTHALPAGEHVIAFRVYDQNDNVGIEKLVIRVP